MRRVVITGMGVVSPIGVGRDAFWDALAAGKQGIAPITHFDASSFDVRLAGEVKDHLHVPDSVASLARRDSKIAFAYVACLEALRHAHVDNLDANTLLHVGTGLETFELSKLVSSGKADFHATIVRSLDAHEAPLQLPLDTAARLLATEFGKPGLALTNCSACVASTQAIGHAFQSVRSGRFERAVCGGFDSMINPLGVGGFQLLGALTTDNARGVAACRPFDSARGGAVLGEGAAMFVLEPLERAIAEGKTVLGEICGFGSTMDAYKVTAPAPDGQGTIRAMQNACADAAIAPLSIGHVNAHGTGTLLNDEIEASAIRAVLPDTWRHVPVSSVKSMTGHLIGACGAVELGAALLAFGRNVLPPNPSLEHVGSGCELCHVTELGTTFESEYILKISIGFGGQNASLVLRRPEATRTLL